MKKLMIAAAIVCAAAISQAASISWEATSFTPLTPETCEGVKAYGPTGTGWGNGDSYSCIQMLVWEFSQEDWTKGANKYMDGATLYADYKAGKLTGAKSAVVDSGNLSYITLPGGTGWADAQIVNAAILFLHSDKADYANADYYMANYASQAAADIPPSVQNLGSVIGGNGLTTTGAATSWVQTVPEPTSGLLLLLGVAGLALRRRRA